MGRLDGKVAIVTGAASGNGRGMALRFAHEGAAVVIADVDVAGADETARLVGEQGGRAAVRRCDVSRKAELDALVAAAVQEFGRLDIAVANAGVVESGVDCLTMTEAQWERTIGVNLTGVFFTLQTAANQMIAQGSGGRLIATASIMAEWGSPGAAAYSASKGGVRQLVKSFAMACGRYGITCNGIAPGMIETGMTANITAVPQIVDYFIDRNRWAASASPPTSPGSPPSSPATMPPSSPARSSLPTAASPPACTAPWRRNSRSWPAASATDCAPSAAYDLATASRRRGHRARAGPRPLSRAAHRPARLHGAVRSAAGSGA